MNFITYIIYSRYINKYYVGYSSNTIEERLKKHLTNHKGFTSKAKDWIVLYTKSYNTKTEAIALERKIKKRGAKRYLSDLKLI
jgi:putative endonuclease